MSESRPARSCYGRVLGQTGFALVEGRVDRGVVRGTLCADVHSLLVLVSPPLSLQRPGGGGGAKGEGGRHGKTH